MSIRWRLGIVAIQLLALASATRIVTGHFAVDEPWFLAGLLAIVINSQLIETPFPRPGHLIANVVLFMFLYWAGHDSPSRTGWNIAAVVFGVAAIFAILGISSERPRRKNRASGFKFVARQLSHIAQGEIVFSVVFLLDLLRLRPISSGDFWLLTGAWAGILLAGHVDWARLWSAVSQGHSSFWIESLTGPSMLNVVADKLPPQGTWTEISANSISANAIVVRRILRKDDMWGQLHVSDSQVCERLLAEDSFDLRELPHPALELVGSVDERSTDSEIRFIATKPLSIGRVVSVPIPPAGNQVIYQLAAAIVEHTDVKGGAHLFVRATANQVGSFTEADGRFRRHLWVPNPGSPVLDHHQAVGNIVVPASWERLGSVIGTNLPVFVDLASAAEGHLAILGMTKMGKSSLAERLARRFAESRAVIVLDLTGEYVGKKGLEKYTGKKEQHSQPNLSVCEPEPGDVPADKLRDFLQHILQKVATPEYQHGQPFPRTLIIDEAHQFIPEPAGIGFNAPGRDASYEIGLLMMQIRKYGLSVVLISQRTAVVAKSALSQCENLIAFRSVDQTGLDYLEAVAGATVRTLLPRLRQGQALAFGPAISADNPVAMDIDLVPLAGAVNVVQEALPP